MKVVTWSRESHGLFDYESKNISVKKCKVEKICKIYRSNETDVEIADQYSNINDQNTSYLTQITQQENSDKSLEFCLDPTKQEKEKDLDQQYGNYLIVRSLKNNKGMQKGYTMKAGDLIKLGRIEYLVVEIRDQKQLTATKNNQLSELHNVFTVDENDTSYKQCKICLCDQLTEDDFFISPCQCKGSCQYVHFKCLKQWVESKVSKKQMGVTASYNWKKNECEICKTALPKRIKKDSREIDLVEIERPDCPYLILQSLAQEKNISKNLFVIYGIENDVVCLGRGHNCEVRISDISVSRLHSYIKFINNEFVITDNNSKFGTLVKLTQSIPLSLDKIAVQIGRTVITLVVKQSENKQTTKQNKLKFLQSD